MMRWTSKAAVVAMFALGAGGASAQQCVGFGDVLASDTLVCPAVEWVKNRGVTLGCGTGANYCPNDNVLRSSMALFMQRLGKALSSEVMKDHVTLFGGAALPGEAPTPPLILCDTGVNSSITQYPRRALLNATVSGLADVNAVAYRAFWLYSTDGGMTFQALQDAGQNLSSPRASSAPLQWSGAALAYVLDLPANLPLQVRVGLRRDNVLTGTTGNFTNVNCQMTVNIINANGTTSPL